MLKWLAVISTALVMLVAGAWLTLRRGDIPFPELERRYATATSHYVDLPGGVRMHYRDQGRRDGPVLVLVHGYSASAADWDGWAARLRGRYHLIIPDLPGHGLTRTPKGYAATDAAYVAALDGLVRALRPPPFVVAGSSMGGGIAWRYALARPGQVRGLVLVDAAGWPEPRQTGQGFSIFALMANPVGRILLRDLDSTSFAKEGLESAFGDPRLVTPALLRRYTDLARAPGHRDILLGSPDWERTREPATTARLAGIRTPTLVMAGREDRLIPFRDAERFAAAIPGARLLGYPGVGHLPMEQIPQRSADDLQAWLTEHALDR